LVNGRGNTMPAQSLRQTRDQIAQYRKLIGWRTKAGEFPGAELLGFDDSGWEPCSLGFAWNREEGERWFRLEFSIPERIYGVDISGSRLDIRVNGLAHIELYVDGRFVHVEEHWFDGVFLLAERARPGERHVLALRCPGGEGRGHLNGAELYAEAVERMLLHIATVDARGSLLGELRALGVPGLDEAPQSALELGPEDLQDSGRLLSKVREHDAGLMPASKVLEGFTSFLVGHAHIDMNWLWDFEDTVATCRRTFTSVDALMDEFPDFVFSQSQAAVYKMMEDLRPEVFALIKRRVKEGRWDVTASTWVEGDLNMASGESLVRQTTYALRYVEERLGVTPMIAWCPDTFGHPWTYPQILKRCGIRYYYAHRCTRGEGEHLFHWEAPDGSRVLVFNEGVTYNNKITPDLVSSFPKMLRHFGLRSHMVVFGVGDHGGGPTRMDLRNAVYLNEQTGFPRFRHAHAKDFYQAVEKSPRIPVVKNELNFVFEGCYTTHGDIKLMNRRGEGMLHEAEALSSMASTMGLPYPGEELEAAWQRVLFNQFHDLLDGSAIHVAYEHSRQIFSEAAQACDRLIRRATSQIVGDGEDKPQRGITAFNALGWERLDVARLPLPEGVGEEIGLVEAQSRRRIPAQRVGKDLIFIARTPPLGYTSYEISDEGPPNNDPDAPRAIAPTRQGGSYVLENRFFRISLDPTSGTITSLFDKRLSRDLVGPNEPANLFQICYEKPHGMSAWTIGPISRTENLLGDAQSEVAYQGPIQAALKVSRRFGRSKIEQHVVIYRDIPRIDFETEIDWQEIGGPDVDSPMLKVAFPWSFSSSTFVREIPFGHIASPTDGREIPALTFIDLPGDGFGIALLNDCKYGHDVKGNTMRLTLLRSAYDPDPLPDMERHHNLLTSPSQGGLEKCRGLEEGPRTKSPLEARLRKGRPAEAKLAILGRPRRRPRRLQGSG